MASSGYYRCQIARCPYMSLTINELLRHLKVVNYSDFKSGCCIGGCVDQFESFAALKSHVYRKHYIRPLSSDAEDKSHSVEVDTDAQHQRWLAYHLKRESFFIQKITLGPIISCSCLCEEVHLEAMLHDTCDQT